MVYVQEQAFVKAQGLPMFTNAFQLKFTPAASIHDLHRSSVHQRAALAALSQRDLPCIQVIQPDEEVSAT